MSDSDEPSPVPEEKKPVPTPDEKEPESDDFEEKKIVLDREKFLRNPGIIKNFSEEVLLENADLCYLALEYDLKLIRYVPDELLTQYDYATAFDKFPAETIGCIPLEYLTEKMVDEMLDKHMLLIREIPAEFFTLSPRSGNTRSIASRLYYNQINKFAQAEINSRTQRKIHKDSEGNLISTAENEPPGEGIFECPVGCVDPHEIGVPAWQKNLWLRYFYKAVPSEYLTAGMCEELLMRGIINLDKVPDELVTREMCKLAIRAKTANTYDVPERFQTVDFYVECVQHNRSCIVYIPHRMRTEEFYKAVLTVNVNFINKIPQTLLTEKFLDEILLAYPNLHESVVGFAGAVEGYEYGGAVTNAIIRTALLARRKLHFR